MLKVQEAGDETRPQNRTTWSGLKWLGGDAVNGCPIDHVGQLDQWMMQVDMGSQRVALCIAVLENTAFPAHGSLGQICKEKASYIGYSCKSNTDLSQPRPHGCWAFALFQRRLNMAEVWGVEPIPETANTALRYLDQIFKGNFCEELDLSAQYFDVISFNDVFEHLPDPWAALWLATGKLAPDGCVVISLLNLRHIDNFLHILKDKDFN